MRMSSCITIKLCESYTYTCIYNKGDGFNGDMLNTSNVPLFLYDLLIISGLMFGDSTSDFCNAHVHLPQYHHPSISHDPVVPGAASGRFVIVLKPRFQ